MNEHAVRDRAVAVIYNLRVNKNGLQLRARFLSENLTAVVTGMPKRLKTHLV